MKPKLEFALKMKLCNINNYIRLEMVVGKGLIFQDLLECRLLNMFMWFE